MKNLNNCSVLHKIIFINGIDIKKEKTSKKESYFFEKCSIYCANIEAITTYRGFQT
ncbi:MAG: hypothetical protein PWQ77_632 [Kosmotogales bacterium]|nr:hypothetical protein [Kosmotogales bacterium]